MVDSELHSVVLAMAYRVDDVARMRSMLDERRILLSSIGAHHLVMYSSIWEAGRVFVTVGIRHRQSVEELLRTPLIFEWFDAAGVNDIPAVFAGEVVEKIDLAEAATWTEVPGLVIGVIARVEEVAVLLAKVHSGLNRFRRAGVRKIWIYRAFDDDRELMILQEVDSEATARQWIGRPDLAAEWMSATGSADYPPIFVGELAQIISADESR
jgi:hypothetical protein